MTSFPPLCACFSTARADGLRPEGSLHSVTEPDGFAGAADGVVPPLQPQLACQRLANFYADTGDLCVERVEGEQTPAPVGAREQRREEAVLVGRANHIFAMGEDVVHRRQDIATHR